MVLEAILLTVSLVGFVLAYWSQIKKWLTDIIDGVYKSLKDIIHAADVFIQELKDLKDQISEIIYKLIYKIDGKWIEEKTTKRIKNTELPPNIREKIDSNKESLITKEMEMELELAI